MPEVVDRPALSFDPLMVPNCVECLHPMTPVVGAWWCAPCRVSNRPEDGVRDAFENVQVLQPFM